MSDVFTVALRRATATFAALTFLPASFVSSKWNSGREVVSGTEDTASGGPECGGRLVEGGDAVPKEQDRILVRNGSNEGQHDEIGLADGAQPGEESSETSEPHLLLEDIPETPEPPLHNKQDQLIVVRKNSIDEDQHVDALCDTFESLDIARKVSHPTPTGTAKEEPLETIEKQSLPSNRGMDQDQLISEFSALNITDCATSLAPATTEASRDSYEDSAAKKVGARLTDAHRSLPLDGGQAHEISAIFVDACGVDGVPEKVEILLAGVDGGGDETTTLKGFGKAYVTKDGDRLKKNAPGVKSLTSAGKERLLAYLRDDKNARPWFEARSFGDWRLFPDAAHFNGADVCQGDIDNCYFPCALSLAMEHYPDCIEKRITRIDNKETGRSRFLVRHWDVRRGGCISPNPKSRVGPIRTEVGDTFYAYTRLNRKGGPGTPLHCRSRSQALYAPVFERAWQKHRSGGDGGSYEDIANENSMEAEAVLHFLTGLKFMQTKLMEDGISRASHRSPASQKQKDSIWKLVCSALQEGRAVSAGTYAKGSGRNKKPCDEWKNHYIIAFHNYALLDAGEDAEHGRFVVLRNPHGKQLSPFVLESVPAWPAGADNTEDGPELGEDGVFRLSLSEFFRYFEAISYAEETCKWYPIKRCHRYRPFFANRENIKWCYETEPDKEDECENMAPRRLVFHDQ